MAIDVEKRLWTVDEYFRIAEAGIFGDERVELIEGEIVKMAAHGDRHIWSIIRTTETLVLAFHATHAVACQVSLVMSERTCLEPDFNVVNKATAARRINEGDLVVEVSDSSLRFDRKVKSSLYARKGLTDYWIVNLVDGVLEVYRNPQPERKATYGYAYADVAIYHRGQRVSPLCRPELSFDADDLLHPVDLLDRPE
jgi:Uma2 family endonuclease